MSCSYVQPLSMFGGQNMSLPTPFRAVLTSLKFSLQHTGPQHAVRDETVDVQISAASAARPTLAGFVSATWCMSKHLRSPVMLYHTPIALRSPDKI